MAKKGYSEADWFKDPPREEGWITEQEARELFGTPAGELISWDYIEEERRGEKENWVKPLPEVAAQYGLHDLGSAKRKSKSKTAPADPANFSSRKRTSSANYPWGTRPIYITEEETARRLGLSLSYTKRLLCGGMFMPARRNGKRMATLQLVERYLAAKAELAERRRAAKPKTYRVESGVANETESSGPNAAEQDYLADVWITVRKAAELLGLGRSMVYNLVAQRKFESRRTESNTIELRAGQVMDLVDRRERRLLRGAISPKEWKQDLRHPVYRTKIEAAPGDELISRKEAAAILGCHPSGLTLLVRAGKLFAWTKCPGRQGVPVYFSRNQIMRYSRHPLRLRYQEARRAESPHSKPERQYPDDETGFWKDLRQDYLERTSSRTERDYGEYYTARQVARLLNVSLWTVYSMRRSKRLPGYRKPIDPARTRRVYENRRWWFFKKEDVHNLMHDPERLKRRERFRRSQTPEAKAAREDLRLREFFGTDDEYIPHDPRNVLYLPPEVRRQLKEEPPPIW